MFEAVSGMLLTATGWTGRLVQQVGQLVHRQAVGSETKSARNRVWPPNSTGVDVIRGVGDHLPLGLGSPAALDPAGLLTLAALPAILVTAVGALRAAGNRPRPHAGLGGVAFAVQLHHHPRTNTA
jgi:hypothetical protein